MIIKRTQPQNLLPEHAALFNRSSTCEINIPSVIELSNVFIFWQGQVFNKRVVLRESLSTELFLSRYNGLFFFRGMLSAFLRKKLIKVDEPCLVIHDEWSMNYFHWLTDALSRIYLVRDRLEKLILILPESYNSDYHQQTLKKFGIKRILYTNPRLVIQASTLVLPEHTAPAGHYNPDILKSAVKVLTDKVVEQNLYGDKIYISRSRANVRKISNETEVQSCLVRMGFQILYMEDHGLFESIRFMKSARILVSIHGAGLTNLIFMKPGSCLLELRKEDPSDVYNTYFTLSSVFGIRYYYLACGSMDKRPVQQSDITVDISRLEQTCGEMIRNLEAPDLAGNFFY